MAGGEKALLRGGAGAVKQQAGHRHQHRRGEREEAQSFQVGMRTSCASESLDVSVFLLLKRAMVESHVLNVTYDNLDSAVVATVTADDYFGARHAIESLFQAVDYDDVRKIFCKGIDSTQVSLRKRRIVAGQTYLRHADGFLRGGRAGVYA